jgi:arylsulfatase A
LEVADDFDDVQALKRFTDRTIQFIKANRERPFFAYVPLTSPHKPVIPAPEFVGKSQCGAYGDFVMETDFRLGQILDTLDELNLTKNTLVIFTSDNGAERTYKERVNVYDHDSSGVLRGGKRDLYEGGHRVPFLVRWPEVIAPGSKCDVPVCQTDCLATVAELLGKSLPPDAGEDSHSFASALRGETLGSHPRIHHGVNGSFAIRDGRWKLLLTKTPALFDLQKDVEETSNVIAQHSDIATKLEAKLDEIVRNGRSTQGPPQKNEGGTDFREWTR